MRPRNQLAEKLLAKLAELKVTATHGYFGGTSYCLAISVKNVADAFALGQKINLELCAIGFDHIPKTGESYLVFRDALVQA